MPAASTRPARGRTDHQSEPKRCDAEQRRRRTDTRSLAERPTLLTVVGGAMIVGARLAALRLGSPLTIAPPEVAGAVR